MITGKSFFILERLKQFHLYLVCTTLGMKWTDLLLFLYSPQTEAALEEERLLADSSCTHEFKSFCNVCNQRVFGFILRPRFKGHAVTNTAKHNDIITNPSNCFPSPGTFIYSTFLIEFVTDDICGWWTCYVCVMLNFRRERPDAVCITALVHHIDSYIIYHQDGSSGNLYSQYRLYWVALARLSSPKTPAL